jgi:hypothetical protein
VTGVNLHNSRRDLLGACDVIGITDTAVIWNIEYLYKESNCELYNVNRRPGRFGLNQKP